MSMMLHRAGIMAGAQRLHPMTRDYIARLQAVDGHEPVFDAANDYLIRELVNLGGAYWDTMGTMTTLCGKLFAGLLVPLRDGMNVGTNINFVSGDFNSKTGLVGDGSSKYINSNRNNNADGQNDHALGAWVTALPSATGVRGLIGSNSTTDINIGSSGIFRSGMHTTAYQVRSRFTEVSDPFNVSSTADALGLVAISRSAGSNFTFRAKGANTTVTGDSMTPGNFETHVLRSQTFYGNQRITLYHIGPALNLATLDGILTEYMARIEEATL